ncbi:MAG: hypothetical protein MZV70_36875 [Desulfobacterales bacterium]|nr:hypothetical protein [Desulfobacterales bacterium]
MTTAPNSTSTDTLKGGDYYNIPELVDVMANGSEPALNWLIDEGGAQIRETVTRAGGHTAYRTRLGGCRCRSRIHGGASENCRESAERRWS